MTRDFTLSVYHNSPQKTTENEKRWVGIGNFWRDARARPPRPSTKFHKKSARTCTAGAFVIQYNIICKKIWRCVHASTCILPYHHAVGTRPGRDARRALFTERQNTTVTFSSPKKPRQDLFTIYIILNFPILVNEKRLAFFEKNAILAIFKPFLTKIALFCAILIRFLE